MKRLALVLCLLIAALAGAQSVHESPSHDNNVLVLIQPALAGPDVNPLNYWQPQWVLWPPTVNNSDGGRLLSIATGENWVGNGSDFLFAPVKGGGWRAKDFGDLTARGHFEVRRQMLGNIRTALLVDTTGSASPNAMRLALNEDSPVVTPWRLGDRGWPSRALMVTEASGWDEIARIERSTAGRVLVVEYPPSDLTRWTRYWLKGHGWMIGDVGLSSSPESAVVPMQVDLPAPGLIRARHLVSLIQHPETFRAAKIDIRSWPGSNRFLEVNRSFGLAVAAVWIAMICGLTAWGVSLVSAERSGHVLPVLLSWALLSPAVVSLAGLAGRFLGVEHWSVWLVLSSLILVMLSYALASGLRKWSTGHHPLLAVFAVGLVTMAAIDPIWSFMSPVFGGRSGVVSPLALGAVFGYLVGFIASLSGAGTVAQWVGRAACFAFLAGGLGLRAWWTPDLGSTLFVPVAALLIGEGHFRWPMLVAFGLWPSSLVPLVTGGFVWAPMGLLVHGHDRQGINLAGYVDFIGSPSLALFILVAGGIAIFGFRFFFHQMRMLGKLDARRHALSFAALSAAAFGLLHPVFLFSSLTVGAGALMAMLFDAVQTM